jgi:hypothetical protein
MTNFYAIHLHASSSTRTDCTRSIADIINFRLRSRRLRSQLILAGCCLCVGTSATPVPIMTIENAHPDPHHQRIDVSFDNETSCVGIQALVDQVKVFGRSGTNPRDRLRLPAGLIEAPLGIHRGDLLVTLEDIDDGPLAAVVVVVFLSVRLTNQCVGPSVILSPKPISFSASRLKGAPRIPIIMTARRNGRCSRRNGACCDAANAPSMRTGFDRCGVK